MTDDQPREVTVVVVTWEARDLVLRCLAALAAQTTLPARVRLHVVDNASHDGTAEAVARDFPDATVQVLTTNTGFAGGCSAALAQIASEWVVLVNNDAVVEADFLERLLAERDGHPGTAAWTARVLLAADVDGASRVNSTGVVVHCDGNGADRDYLVRADAPGPPAEVFGFCGAAVLLRASAVREVGGFDPSYFLYYEDTDLSWRLRLGGWDVRYVHRAIVHHEHGASSGIGSPRFRYYNERNRLTTLLKDAPWSLVVPVLLRHPVMSGVRIARGGPERAVGSIRLRAYTGFLRRAPHTLRQRRSMPPAMRARRPEVARLLLGADPSR